MSKLQRAVYIISYLCFLAALIVSLCGIAGVLPGLFASSVNSILISVYLLGKSISATEEYRILMIILCSFLLLYSICVNTTWFDALLNMRIT